MTEPTKINYAVLSQSASQLFTPATPITNKDLFAGRIGQITKIIDVINQPGQHAILFGERGVGKTSLANVLAPIARAVQPNLVSAKVNCDVTDTFETIWRKILQELSWIVNRIGTGFTGEVNKELHSLAERLPHSCSPNDIRLLLAGAGVPTVLVFDEFDRLEDGAAKVFTDLIKTLSDYSVPTTVVLVGVATTVDRLIHDHASIERALVQIAMQRMDRKEIRQIILGGVSKLGMVIEESLADQIVQISQGLPHYAHLISLYTVRNALNRQSLRVFEEDLEVGIRVATENAHHSIKTQYHAATSSSHKSALFEQVLLACTFAKKDQLSFFRAADVAKPLSTIMGGEYDVPAFARHLSEFCTSARASTLVKQGESRRIKYRFSNPLIEPFIVMNGRTQGLISTQTLEKLATG